MTNTNNKWTRRDVLTALGTVGTTTAFFGWVIGGSMRARDEHQKSVAETYNHYSTLAEQVASHVREKGNLTRYKDQKSITIKQDDFSYSVTVTDWDKPVSKPTDLEIKGRVGIHDINFVEYGLDGFNEYRVRKTSDPTSPPVYEKFRVFDGDVKEFEFGRYRNDEYQQVKATERGVELLENVLEDLQKN